MSFAQRKATEYLSMLKQKSVEEITSMRNSLLPRLKQERSKQAPDQSTVQNLNWQLSLLGRELASRKPADKKEPMQAIQDDQLLSVGGETENPLKSKTLDELNKMLSDAEKELETLKKAMSISRITAEASKANSDREKILSVQISAIKGEISTRSSQAQEEAKKDVAKTEAKWSGFDSDLLMIGALSGVIGGAIAWGFGKNKWIIAGAVIVVGGAGAGITYGIKQASLARKKPSPSV